MDFDQGLVAMLSCFLERSAKKSVRVSIAIAEHVTWAYSTYQPLFDILMQTCDRWISLKITGDVERLSCSNFLGRYGAPQLPNLEKAELKGPPSFLSFDPPSDLPEGSKLQCAIARHAPHLKTISLRSLRTFSRQRFSWDRINLEVNDFSVRHSNVLENASVDAYVTELFDLSRLWSDAKWP
ncbi:hypothetical protein MPER_04761 [Moniliophthora perniciosa FA553]|nr:hypothetical protein MPER_04761 [Moniliophthora perniciosa FA553]